MLRILALLAAFMAAAPAVSQDYGEIGSYWAEIGYEDFFNSSGKRLSGLGNVLQQDRANFHRFGIAHRGDEFDPIFSNRAARAKIPALYRLHGPIPRLEALVRQGQPFRVFIFICGYGRNPTFIAVVPEWVQDHSGCF